MRKMIESRRSFQAKALVILASAALLAAVVGCETPVTTYSLTITSTAGGAVTVPGEDVFDYSAGTVVELEAVAYDGHRFVNWTGDVGTLANANAASTTVTIDGDCSITANFVAVYALSIASTTGGSATAPGEGMFSYDAGTVVDLVASPASGYRFVEWKGDVSTVSNVEAASTTITTNGHYSVIAAFVVVYDLSISSTTGGSVTTPGEGIFIYDAGTVVSLIAAADVGYRFVEWTGDVSTVVHVNAAATTITIDSTYVVSASFEAEEPVFFADPNLEAAIREAIDVVERPIYPSDLEGLTYLDASVRGIRDLTGLEHCTDLTHLFLEYNQIDDVSPLAGLINLTQLWLEGNQIIDVYPLANLTRLTELFLGRNEISDISALADLTNLTFLHLGKGRNQISDISPIANLTKLTHLNLGGNQISDISPLSSLTELTFLRIFENQISDLSALENLTKLNHLHLGVNRISDVSPLANLTSLRLLDLWGNGMSDISPLAGLTDLESLHLSYNQISDISPLANLTSLTELSVPRNPVSDISPIANLTNLRALWVTIDSVNDIPLLLHLTNLTALGLHIRQIRHEELSRLADVRDVLVSLDLDSNQISNISPLATLTNLTDLRLWRNKISDISPVQGLTNLIFLGLGGNQISDISPLTGLANLTALYLWDNQISDISPLVDNAGLGPGDMVWLGTNPLSAQSINEHIPALQVRGVTVNY